ncbi:MAG: cation diffusion facilitator family transporter [Coriobacteriales bacterium]|jgi:cation diffusion facilitator family transporter|nr:cation diffusion facilitator family transporter [Coriobacteriales bacterium]
MPQAQQSILVDKHVPHTLQKAESESKGSVIAAILANIAIGIVKFIAAAISGSSAMMSEGIHSIVDSGNGALILLGMKRAGQRPDLEHPFGYGKELYFWTLIVSLLIFALGGLLSITEGARAVIAADPAKISGSPVVSYAVIGIAAVIEGMSLRVALKAFNGARGTTPPLRFIREAKDPSLFTVVLEDGAAELGLVFAFCGLFFGRLLNEPRLDGAASICIGLLLCAVALILLVETKGLLVGEGMRTEDLAEIRALVESDVDVDTCGRILTMYMGPQYLLVNIDVGFRPDITADELLQAIDRLETLVYTRFPETSCMYVETETLKLAREQHDQFVTAGI